MSHSESTKGTGRLYVISAPSGTGKTTVVRSLLARHPDLIESVSYTTRPARSGEQDGADYHFVDADTFRRLIDEGFFAEWAEVHGAFYGTPVHPIEQATAAGKIMVLDVDVQGGMALKDRFPEAVTVFLLPPSEEELIRRLTRRGTEGTTQIERRLRNAKQEMTYCEKYDYQIVNDDVDHAVDELARLIGLG